MIAVYYSMQSRVSRKWAEVWQELPLENAIAKLILLAEVQGSLQQEVIPALGLHLTGSLRR